VETPVPVRSQKLSAPCYKRYWLNIGNLINCLRLFLFLSDIYLNKFCLVIIMRKQYSAEKLKKIDGLFVEAEKEDNLRKKEKIIKEARKSAKRNNISIPTKWRECFCRNCNTWFNEKNQRIRISNGKISKKCLSCGRTYRRKFKK
jgi:RNase P subunit RPR2